MNVLSILLSSERVECKRLRLYSRASADNSSAYPRGYNKLSQASISDVRGVTNHQKEKIVQKMKVMGIAVMAMIVFFTAMPAFAWEPLGYPWETYGEATVATGVERGFKIDGWVEQGIDWVGFGRGNKWILNTFIQPRLLVSDHLFSDPQFQWWNNRASVYIGIKVLNRDINFGSRQHWGKLVIGIRGEFSYYLDGRHDSSLLRDEMRGVVFLQWSAGGDWKKR